MDWWMIEFCTSLSFKEKYLICATVFGFLSYFIWRRKNKKIDINFDGFVEPGFEKVAYVFKQNLESGLERGGNFAAYYNGNLVVDIWGGFADEESSKLRRKDSTSLAFSATKGVTAICMAQLVERGLLDYKAPVMKYWSEFGQNGKEDVTVEMLLSHQAGLYTLAGGFEQSMINDENKLARFLAEQKPLWKPGSIHGYHARTFGLYCDQLVKRVDPGHRPLWKYYEDEIAVPFGIDFVIKERLEKFYKACRHGSANFGLWYVISRIIPVIVKHCFSLIWYYVQNRRLYIYDVLKNTKGTNYKACNDPYFRTIPCGSTSGVGTARGLAKLYGILANGGLLPIESDIITNSVDSVDLDREKTVGIYASKMVGYFPKRLLKPETIAQLYEPLTGRKDHVFLVNLQFGRGMMVREAKFADKKNSIFGHMGAGCQMAFCDPQNGIGWAYLTNYANTLYGIDECDKRYDGLEEALYECVEKINRANMNG